MGGFWQEWDTLLREWLLTLEALEKEKRNPAPSTYTHDLLCLELRSGGRGLGQARAINTGRGVGVSGYPEAAAVPVRERDGMRHVALTVCVNVSHSSFCQHRSLGPYPSLWVSLSLSWFLALTLSRSLSLLPRILSLLILGLVFPSHSECLSCTQVFVSPSGSMSPSLISGIPSLCLCPALLGFCPLSWGLCSPLSVPLSLLWVCLPSLSVSVLLWVSLSHSPAPPFAPPPAYVSRGFPAPLPRPKLDGGSGGSGLSRADLESGLVEGMWGAG